jgi:hypothetical protein
MRKRIRPQIEHGFLQRQSLTSIERCRIRGTQRKLFSVDRPARTRRIERECYSGKTVFLFSVRDLHFYESLMQSGDAHTRVSYQTLFDR